MAHKIRDVPQPSLTVTENNGEYSVQFSSYTTEIRIFNDERVRAFTSMSATTTLDGVEKASMAGVITLDGEKAELDAIYPAKDIPPKEGLPALGALVVSLEEVLRRRGVKYVRGETNPGFAKFLGQMGYHDTGERPDADDSLGSVVVRKIISQDTEIRLPEVLKIHASRRAKQP